MKLTQAIQSRALVYGSIATALFIGATYVSTSLSTILSVVLGLLWLLSAQFIKLPDIIKTYPVVAWSLLLFVCFILGLSYSGSKIEEGFSMLNKYRELCFIPVFISFLSIKRYRYWAWSAFFIASVLILLISYLMDLGIIDLNRSGFPSFKSRITHSILIAFFAFFCLHKLFDCKRYSYVFLGLFVLCLHNLFFVVEGRTGELIIFFLVPLFAMQRLTKRGRLLTFLAITGFLVLFLAFSDKSNRINEGIADTLAYFKPVPEQTESSMGLRYTFWKNSLKLIAEKPLLGHGTGSFAKEYQRITNDNSVVNPHNEFLMIGVQLGFLGLFVFSGFLASQYYFSRKLPDQEKYLAQGILLSLIITSFFNSPILDHTEGHWFSVMIALCFSATIKTDKTIHDATLLLFDAKRQASAESENQRPKEILIL